MVQGILAGILSFALLIAGLLYEHVNNNPEAFFIITIYAIAYIIVGGKTVWVAVKGIFKGDFFGEKFLMSIATIGAFAIGEYEEGVAVMLFYKVGNCFNILP